MWGRYYSISRCYNVKLRLLMYMFIFLDLFIATIKLFCLHQDIIIPLEGNTTLILGLYEIKHETKIAQKCDSSITFFQQHT